MLPVDSVESTAKRILSRDSNLVTFLAAILEILTNKK